MQSIYRTRMECDDTHVVYSSSINCQSRCYSLLLAMSSRILLPVVNAHGSVELCEATPFSLVGVSKESLNGRETNRDLRSALYIDASRDFYRFFLRTNSVGGGGVRCQTFFFVLFSLFSRSRAGLATV